MYLSLFGSKPCVTLYDTWKKLCRTNRASILSKEDDTKKLETNLKAIPLQNLDKDKADTILAELDHWLSNRSASSSRYSSGLQLKKYIYQKKIEALRKSHDSATETFKQKYHITSISQKPIEKGSDQRIAARPNFNLKNFENWLNDFQGGVVYALNNIISNDEIKTLENQLEQLNYAVEQKLLDKSFKGMKKDLKNTMAGYKNIITDLKSFSITNREMKENQNKIKEIDSILLALSSNNKPRKTLKAVMCLPLTNMLVDFDFAFDFITEFGNLSTLFT